MDNTDTKPILWVQHYDTPWGTLILGDRKGQLCLCYWECAASRDVVIKRILRYSHAVVKQGVTDSLLVAIGQLEEFLSGKRRCFDLPLLLLGTDFQQSVWKSILQVPYGDTIAYCALAENIGKPKAVRAVAHAVAQNPLQIFIPCHRILGVAGQLTGYAGGLPAKIGLLNQEQHPLNNNEDNYSRGR